MDDVLIMRTLLKQQVIVCSWGISKIKCSNRNLEFYVSGFKYKGKIILTINQNTVNISLCDINKVVEGVLFENLVDILDSLIEKTDDYYQSILKTIACIE